MILGHRIEVLDERQSWLEAHVIEERVDSVLIHYRGYHAKFDEWLPRSTDRVRPFGRHKAVGKRKRLRPAAPVVAGPKPDRKRCITATGDQYVCWHSFVAAHVGKRAQVFLPRRCLLARTSCSPTTCALLRGTASKSSLLMVMAIVSFALSATKYVNGRGVPYRSVSPR